MMRRILLLFALSCSSLISTSQQAVTPDIIYGKLFHDVQMARVFEDGKTFPDCIPKRAPADIVHDYLRAVNSDAPGFSLKEFVENNFELPAAPPAAYTTREKNIAGHIKNLWPVLKRERDKSIAGSSLLPLPYSYVVPGGRFREIYYWDSYFTMLGLKAGGQQELMEDMVKNFAWLIDTYGHIPNGNRTYYLSRSQPPFFALMIDLLASVKGDGIYTRYLPQMEKEYRFWMDGSGDLKENEAHRRVVRMKDSVVLNRYWDDSTAPRQESYREDIATAEASGRNKTEMYRNLRAAAESGFDFSSRWFADKKNIATIQTTHIIPVDLNSLLYKLELNIAKAKMMQGDEQQYNFFSRKAQERLNAINKYCWSEGLNFYTDYNFKTFRTTEVVSPAGMYPFCLFESRLDYMSLLARKSAVTVRDILLKKGGIVTSRNDTGQQWDGPNGWAPLQWMTIWGFARCGQIGIAREITNRWMKLNEAVFSRTGKLMEKYNVIDTSLEAGGGEYPGQDGFGWTNGVYLALLKGNYF